MFIENAYAQVAGAPADGGAMMTILPLVIMIAVFYFLVMRPQIKREREKHTMQDALRRGDRVLTVGGIIGQVAKVEDDHYLQVTISDNVHVRMAKSSVEAVIDKGIPATVVEKKSTKKINVNAKKPAKKASTSAKKPAKKSKAA